MLGLSLEERIRVFQSQPPPPVLEEGSFYAQLAQNGARIFSDDDFAALYAKGRGRPSVPPHLLCMLLLLQWYCGCSDAEAIQRSAYDMRWQAVLGLPPGMPLCARSTLEAFRDLLIAEAEAGYVFQKSLKEAKRVGLLKGPALLLVLDTKPVLGRGAVLDTFNLIGEAIKKTAGALAEEAGMGLGEFLRLHGLERYAATSLKGSADLDWGDEAQRDAFLTELVADARRVLALVAQLPQEHRPKTGETLAQVLAQDVEESADAQGTPRANIKEGTAKGRVPSVTDPQQRHGRKSASKRFTGSKVDIGCDKSSQIIVAVEVLDGDAPDASGATDRASEAESNTGFPVEDTTADGAYSGGATRREFADAKRTFHAKVPQESTSSGLYAKSRFSVDLESGSVTCPAGETTSRATMEKDGGRVFHFGAACQNCPLRSACTRSASGRSVHVHAEEALLQEARMFQASPEGRAVLRARVVVEHCLARLGNLGVGQARYMGRAKTRFQAFMCAAVANLRWTWNWAAREGTETASLVAFCLYIYGLQTHFWAGFRQRTYSVAIRL